MHVYEYMHCEGKPDADAGLHDFKRISMWILYIRVYFRIQYSVFGIVHVYTNVNACSWSSTGEYCVRERGWMDGWMDGSKEKVIRNTTKKSTLS